MRICFALPNAWYGGIRSFALNLGRQFRTDGHDVSALIAARCAGHDALGDLAEIGEVMHLSVCAQERVLVRSRFLRRAVRAIERSEPDALILNHTLWAQAALPYIDPLIRRIVVVHGMGEDEIKLAAENSKYWDALVAVGPGLQRLLVERLGRDRVWLIPVGVAAPPCPPVHDYKEPVLKICYVGRVSQPQKNVFLIPLVASSLARRGLHFRWTIVGDGPDLHALKTQIAEAGLSGLFDFAGACSRTEVEGILGRQHILVLPSHTESIGHVLLEAQMLGVVPVASRLPGATDFVITNERNGLLCAPGDPESFAGAIALLSVERDELERLAEAAQTDVRERFEISKTAAQYYELIQSLPRTSRELRRKVVAVGYYPIPRSLLPSRLSTVMRLGWSLVHREHERDVGRGTIDGSG